MREKEAYLKELGLEALSKTKKRSRYISSPLFALSSPSDTPPNSPCDPPTPSNSPSLTPPTIEQSDGYVKFTCNTCGRSFQDNAHLKRHKENMHTDGIFICTRPYCELHQVFSTRWEKEKHVKSCVMICHRCGKEFTKKKRFDGHQRYHSDLDQRMM